jgi:hypothetical protein
MHAGKEPTMTRAILKRMTTVSDAGEFDKRKSALSARMLPYLQKQPGFVSWDLARDGDRGGMIETTEWRSDPDARAYLRNGAAAMAATWLDGFFPTAPYPNGNWTRTVEAA